MFEFGLAYFYKNVLSGWDDEGGEGGRGDQGIEDAPGHPLFTGLAGDVLMCLAAIVGGFFTGSIGTGSDIAVCESDIYIYIEKDTYL